MLPRRYRLHVLKYAAGLKSALAEGIYGDLDDETVDPSWRGRPLRKRCDCTLNSVGDKFGTLQGRRQGHHAARLERRLRRMGRSGLERLAALADWGGQGLPHAVNAACIEMWNSASMAFGIGPVLTMAAIDALHVYGSDALKKNISQSSSAANGWHHAAHRAASWIGCRALRSKPSAQATAHTALRDQNLHHPWWHDLTDNIIHFVLARLPDAPAGTKGISLFLVPKVMPDGARNDVRAHSIEHKLGIHASPTCTMVYGDRGGAVGYLIGEENNGMACMFTMMIGRGLLSACRGSIAERATQQALAYARERKQSPAGAIIAYPDVKRMLLTMRALTAAARAICYATAIAIDRSLRAQTDAARKRTRSASLLTPVAKAFSTDIGTEVASLGIQVHGGMGYVEEAHRNTIGTPVLRRFMREPMESRPSTW